MWKKITSGEDIKVISKGDKIFDCPDGIIATTYIEAIKNGRC